MKIRMVTNARVSLDGLTFVVWRAGEVYDASSEHAHNLITEGTAVEAEPGPSETKVVAPEEPAPKRKR